MFTIRITWKLASGRTVGETMNATSAKHLAKIVGDVTADTDCLIVSIEREAQTEAAPAVASWTNIETDHAESA